MEQTQRSACFFIFILKFISKNLVRVHIGSRVCGILLMETHFLHGSYTYTHLRQIDGIWFFILSLLIFYRSNENFVMKNWKTTNECFASERETEKTTEKSVLKHKKTLSVPNESLRKLQRYKHCILIWLLNALLHYFPSQFRYFAFQVSISVCSHRSRKLENPWKWMNKKCPELASTFATVSRILPKRERTIPRTPCMFPWNEKLSLSVFCFHAFILFSHSLLFRRNEKLWSIHNKSSDLLKSIPCVSKVDW